MLKYSRMKIDFVNELNGFISRVIARCKLWSPLLFFSLRYAIHTALLLAVVFQQTILQHEIKI